jgi:hypothetical protein
MDKNTEKILTHDSLADTEQILGGKHWSQFNDKENMFSLGKFMIDNQIKDEHLKSIGDTHFGMSWNEFKKLIQQHGFINAYSYKLDYKGWSNPTKEEVIIYYHQKKGLIIYAESFNNKTTVNGGKLYGEIKANNTESEKVIWKWLSTGGCIDADNMIYDTSHDVREGLFSKLNELESAGTFLNKWTKKDRFLWFVDYVEDDVEGYDYKKITLDKIKKCPKELQDIIGI